ncbi:MAG: hypothetical protein JW727_00200 [Candidatus Aenigmarchaeota archaeon]|nr:hypothetical protein [Candidatus Aenigmarchaeota archaeon]
MEKLTRGREILKATCLENTFLIGSDDHVWLDQVRGTHTSPASVCKQHDNFYGLALKLRRTLNN